MTPQQAAAIYAVLAKRLTPHPDILELIVRDFEGIPGNLRFRENVEMIARLHIRKKVLQERPKANNEREPAARITKIGPTQFDVLRALWEHGSWSIASGWTWGAHSATERIMDSLERRDLVMSEMVENFKGHHQAVRVYTTTKEGAELAKSGHGRKGK